MMEIDLIEKSLREKFTKNKEKILTKLDLNYLNKHNCLPIIYADNDYISLNNEFEKHLEQYSKEFQQGNILDALWSFSSKTMMKLDSYNLTLDNYLMSLFYIRKSQMFVCFTEGRISQYLSLYFEATSYFITATYFGSVYNATKFSKSNSLEKYMDFYKREYLENNEWILNHMSIDKNFNKLLTTYNISFADVFDKYKFHGYIPSSPITSEKLNMYIEKFIRK